jgi:hypothetical protein
VKKISFTAETPSAQRFAEVCISASSLRSLRLCGECKLEHFADPAIFSHVLSERGENVSRLRNAQEVTIQQGVTYRRVVRKILRALPDGRGTDFFPGSPPS